MIDTQRVVQSGAFWGKLSLYKSKIKKELPFYIALFEMVDPILKGYISIDQRKI